MKKYGKKAEQLKWSMVKESSLLYKERSIRSPEDEYNLFKQFLGELDRGYFVVMCLDLKNQPTAINVCHIGSLNASIVHPREVRKAAILSNTVSILALHNHLSGQPEPSPEDIDVTKRLAEAGSVMGIELIDHWIVGDGRYVSLKDKGYI